MAKTEMTIFPPSISSSLRRRDYKWIEITPEKFAQMLSDKLKACGAKAWMLDVYCSNDAVYRNLTIKWAGYDSVKSISIRFNRDEGWVIDVGKE